MQRILNCFARLWWAEGYKTWPYCTGSVDVLLSAEWFVLWNKFQIKMSILWSKLQRKTNIYL